MRNLILSLAIVLALSTAARADDDLPADGNARIAAQIGACMDGRASACFEAAEAMHRARIASRFGHTPEALRARGEAASAAGCAAGRAEDCWAHGRLLTRRGETARGAAEMQRGCELGDGDACLYLAVHSKRPAQALALFEQACERGRGTACEILVARIGKRDPLRTLALHRKACDGADSQGCVRLGEHDRMLGDRTSASGHFERACQLAIDEHLDGDALVGCDLAGGLASDPVRGRALLQQACEGGLAAGCVHLGERIARGEGGERDWGAGLALVADGCKRGHDRACPALTALRKAPPDWNCTTREQCLRFCDEQLWPACRRLGELTDLEDDWALELACTGGDAPGCRLRGDVGESFAEALPWYRKGCALRDQRSCGYVDVDRAQREPAAAARLAAACARDAAACPLYGIAIGRRDRQRAARVWRTACDARVGVACRFLARSVDPLASDSIDVMVEIVLGTIPHGSGTCCDDPEPVNQADVDAWERTRAEGQRLLRLGCEAGDARSCPDAPGDDDAVSPAAVVALPRWE